MKKIIFIIYVMIVFCLLPMDNKVYAEEIPEELKELYAQSAVLMDADSGRILFGKNETDVMPMASTTKIMTCIITLENMKPDQIGIVSKNASIQPKVHLGVSEGEKYRIRDLLYSLMLESHNDSAVIIAETIGGTVEGFADMMNRKATEIGCKDTYFITPNGLDAEDNEGVHSTTAEDLAKIMRYCIRESPQKEEFLEITREKEYRFSDVDGKRNYICYNHNSFLGMMEGALSGKTGFTNDAGYCYVGALKRDKKTFIVTLLACGWPGNKGYKWKDTRKLMEYALDNYEYRTVSVPRDYGYIIVENGIDKDRVSIEAEKKEVAVLMNDSDTVEVKVVKENSICAPVEKGQKIGAVYHYLDEYMLMSTDLVTAEEAKVKNFRNIWSVVLKDFCLKATSV